MPQHNCARKQANKQMFAGIDDHERRWACAGRGAVYASPPALACDELADSPDGRSWVNHRACDLPFATVGAVAGRALLAELADPPSDRVQEAEPKMLTKAAVALSKHACGR